MPKESRILARLDGCPETGRQQRKASVADIQKFCTFGGWTFFVVGLRNAAGNRLEGTATDRSLLRKEVFVRSILWAILLWVVPVWGEPLDLSTEASWELRLENGESYRVGQRMVTDGGPITTIPADPMAGNVNSVFQGATILGAAYPGETFRESYLRSLATQSAHVAALPASCLAWPEGSSQDVWPGVRQGRLVWMRTSRPGSDILLEHAVVGRLGDSLVSWEERLGQPYARFHLYRATMADIGLQVEAGKVVAMILMEPGQLRTHLLRRGDYREI